MALSKICTHMSISPGSNSYYIPSLFDPCHDDCYCSNEEGKLTASPSPSQSTPYWSSANGGKNIENYKFNKAPVKLRENQRKETLCRSMKCREEIWNWGLRGDDQTSIAGAMWFFEALMKRRARREERSIAARRSIFVTLSSSLRWPEENPPNRNQDGPQKPLIFAKRCRSFTVVHYGVFGINNSVNRIACSFESFPSCSR